MKKPFLLMLILSLCLPGAGLCSDFRDLGKDSLIGSPDQWGAVNAHDPSIVRGDDGKWYVFSTDASVGDVHRCGVQVRVSEDLIHWDYLGTAFDDYETACAAEISAAGLDPSKHQGLWAPEAVKVGNQWRLYYSASTFGSSRSVIGMAVSESVTGPWEDRGIVIRSDANAVSKPNAIDPCLFTDPSGKQYMTWGSFFGGIWLTALDEDGFAEGEAVRNTIIYLFPTGPCRRTTTSGSAGRKILRDPIWMPTDAAWRIWSRPMRTGSASSSWVDIICGMSPDPASPRESRPRGTAPWRWTETGSGCAIIRAHNPCPDTGSPCRSAPCSCPGTAGLWSCP